MGKYASGLLGISCPGLGIHLAPTLGGVGGSPCPTCAVWIPPPKNALPAGSCSSTVASDGTSDAATTAVASSGEAVEGAMDDEFWGTTGLVDGDGREAREGEARRREESSVWVTTEV